MAGLLLLLVMLGILAVSGLAAALRSRSGIAGLLVVLAALVPYGLLWLYVSWRRPHRSATWHQLLPGALFFGVGLEVLHVAAVYVIAPLAESKRGTYGSLGVAAALLLNLYLLSRIAIGSAVVNATLWERRLAVGAPSQQ